MRNVVVVDTYLGDSGKARVVDYLAKKAISVVRFNGGNNAGHTCYGDDGSKYVFHSVPSGVLTKGIVNYITAGCYVNPIDLLDEIDELRSQGVEITPSTLRISDRCHVVLEAHKKIDSLQEEYKGTNKIGSTKKGMSPVAVAKMAKTGLRLRDLSNGERVKASFRDQGEMTFIDHVDFSDQENRLFAAYERLRPFISSSVSDELHSMASNKDVKEEIGLLFEGAQGTFLDVDHGEYPYVTSSNCLAGYSAVSAGISPKLLDEIVGVTKAYFTRVGSGEFPTAMGGELEDDFRKRAGEFGATTGRPRKCGWIDLIALSKAIKLNGVTTLAITRLDTLAGLKTVKVCNSYKDGKPVYTTLDGWDDKFENIKKFSDLPQNAQIYLRYIQGTVLTKIGYVSYGPKRNQMLDLTY